MAEIKVLEEKEKKSGGNVIIRLEEALEMAKDGLIEDVFIVCTGTNKTVLRCWGNGCNPFLMLGAIESSKYDFMTENIEDK